MLGWSLAVLVPPMSSPNETVLLLINMHTVYYCICITTLLARQSRWTETEGGQDFRRSRVALSVAVVTVGTNAIFCNGT